MISEGAGRKEPSFEHLVGREGKQRRLLEALRREALALGLDVVEDVRAHRVVYGRGHVLRSFLDIQPTSSGLRIALYRGRGLKDPREVTQGRGFSWAYFDLESEDEVGYAASLIRQAYASV